MTRRMFLAVPRPPVPEHQDVVSLPKNCTYLPGGLMVDLSADMRCGTCKWWLEDGDFGHLCAYLGVDTDPDFGCTKWEQKPE